MDSILSQSFESEGDAFLESLHDLSVLFLFLHWVEAEFNFVLFFLLLFLLGALVVVLKDESLLVDGIYLFIPDFSGDTVPPYSEYHGVSPLLAEGEDVNINSLVLLCI